MSEAEIVLHDTIEDNVRKIQIDVPFKIFINALFSSSYYLNHVEYSTHHVSVALLGDSFGPTSIDVFPGTESDPSKDREFDDYFSSGDKKTVECGKAPNISRVIVDRRERKHLQNKTGRDYVAESDACVETIISIAEDVVA